MPYIVKKIKSEEVNVVDKKTLILDVEKTAELTRELELNNELGSGLSYKEIIEIKKNFGDLKSFKDVLQKNEESKWNTIILQIDNVENFYDVVWERTVMELMFISQYYISLISNPQSFEQVLRSGEEFEYWFLNNVKYNMLDKIKSFYLQTIEIYANKVTLDIYETDVELKVKEIINEIEQTHLQQVKDLLETTWNDTKIKYQEWIEKQNRKRETIIFD